MRNSRTLWTAIVAVGACLLSGANWPQDSAQTGMRLLKQLQLASREQQKRVSEERVEVLLLEAAVVKVKFSLAQAEIEMAEYLEGTSRLEIAQVEAEVATSKERLTKAKADFSSAQRLAELGFLSDVELNARKIMVTAAETDLLVANTKHTVLLKFTKPKKDAELRGRVQTSKAELAAREAQLRHVMHDRDRALAAVDQIVELSRNLEKAIGENQINEVAQLSATAEQLLSRVAPNPNGLGREDVAHELLRLREEAAFLKRRLSLHVQPAGEELAQAAERAFESAHQELLASQKPVQLAEIDQVYRWSVRLMQCAPDERRAVEAHALRMKSLRDQISVMFEDGRVSAAAVKVTRFYQIEADYRVKQLK